MDYVAMGKRIHSARQHAKMTQATIAEKANISESFYGHIERGTRKASIETLVKLSTVLDVSMDTLLLDTLSRNDPSVDQILTHIKELIDDYMASKQTR